VKPCQTTSNVLRWIGGGVEDELDLLVTKRSMRIGAHREHQCPVQKKSLRVKNRDDTKPSLPPGRKGGRGSRDNGLLPPEFWARQQQSYGASGCSNNRVGYYIVKAECWQHDGGDEGATFSKSWARRADLFFRQEKEADWRRGKTTPPARYTVGRI